MSLAVIYFKLTVVNCMITLHHSPRFYSSTHHFQAFGVPIAVDLLGINIHPSLSTRSKYLVQRCILKLSILWHIPIGSLFLSTVRHRILLFGLYICPLLALLWIRDFGTPQKWLLFILGFCWSHIHLLICRRPNTFSFSTGGH